LAFSTFALRGAVLITGACVVRLGAASDGVARTETASAAAEIVFNIFSSFKETREIARNSFRLADRAAKVIAVP
jgi:hypothetical protein